MDGTEGPPRLRRRILVTRLIEGQEGLNYANKRICYNKCSLARKLSLFKIWYANINVPKNSNFQKVLIYTSQIIVNQQIIKLPLYELTFQGFKFMNYLNPITNQSLKIDDV